MKDLLAASWLLFVTHLPRHVRARRTWIVLAVALFPAGLAWLVTSLSRKPEPQEVAVVGGWLVASTGMCSSLEVIVGDEGEWRAWQAREPARCGLLRARHGLVDEPQCFVGRGVAAAWVGVDRGLRGAQVGDALAEDRPRELERFRLAFGD